MQTHGASTFFLLAGGGFASRAAFSRAGVESLLEKEKRLGSDIKFEDIIDEVAGVYPKIMVDGEMDAGAWSCGMVAGLIHDIPTCKELIDRIMAEAEDIISNQMMGMLAGKVPA